MKHLRWGLLAAGNIAHRFAKGLASTDEATALAVASRSLEKAEAFAQEHNVGRAYGSYEELLADPDVDAIYISTPNHLHAEWSIRCAEAGKHILCEKPVTMNAAELEAVLEAVRKHDVFFMEAFMYRCHPQMARVRELIAEGRVGAVRMLQATFGFNMGLNLENTRQINYMGGGALMDVGCYCVSFCRFVAHEEPTDLHAVCHIGTENRVDEWAAGCLQFPSGISAHFACGIRCSAPAIAAVYGDTGSITITNPWIPEDGKTHLVVNSGGETETLDIVLGRDLYANEALMVAEHLDERQCPFMSWGDSLGQMRALDRLRASMGLEFDRPK